MEHFQPRQRRAHSTLPFVTRPVNRKDFLAFASERDGFEALIHSNVKEVISEKARKALPNETIGLLAGRVLRDERGPYTLVLAAKGARQDEIDATPSHVRISANGHAQVRCRLEESAYGLDLIGWYHSHPTFPARFSPVDVTEQSTWRDPNHIGIVISGVDRGTPFGVYRGPEALLLRPIPASPPPLPPAQTLPMIHVPSARAATGEADRTVSPTVPSLARVGVPVVTSRLKAATKFLPLALSLVALAALFNTFQLNRRIAKLEAAREDLTDNNRAAPIAVPTVIPSPAPSSPPAMSQFDNINSAGRPDIVDRQRTKALIVTPSRRRGTASDRKPGTQPPRTPGKAQRP
jgi:proteasome lid subunit RPN8/RPN11